MTEKKQFYTIIDFETTGLDADTEQLTEMAAIKIDEDGREYGRLQTFVSLTNGRVPSPYAKVTVEDCIGGVDEYQAFSALWALCYDSTVVAQYAPFDFSFMPWGPDNFICTRTLTHLVEPGENPSLQPTCERNGVELLEAHRALDDVLMTKDVFFIQKKRADELGVQYRNTVVDFKKRPLRFTPKHAEVIQE